MDSEAGILQSEEDFEKEIEMANITGWWSCRVTQKDWQLVKANPGNFAIWLVSKEPNEVKKHIFYLLRNKNFNSFNFRKRTA